MLNINNLCSKRADAVSFFRPTSQFPWSQKREFFLRSQQLLSPPGKLLEARSQLYHCRPLRQKLICGKRCSRSLLCSDCKRARQIPSDSRKFDGNRCILKFLNTTSPMTPGNHRCLLRECFNCGRAHADAESVTRRGAPRQFSAPTLHEVLALSEEFQLFRYMTIIL